MADNYLDKLSGIEKDNSFLDVQAGIKKKPDESIVKKTAKLISPYARPVLEMGGLTAGGILGATGGLLTTGGTTSIPAAMAGAGLLYAAGKQGANYIDSLAGEMPEQTPTRKIIETGKDVGSGAGMEMVGPVFGVIAKPAAKLLSKIPMPALTGDAIKKKAGELLVKTTGKAPVYAKNAEEAAKVERQIPGFKASIGERTNDPGLIKLQRTLERSPGEAANALVEQRSGNLNAIRDYVDNAFNSGKTVDNVIDELVNARTSLASKSAAAKTGVENATSKLSGTDAQTAGKNIHAEIKKAMEPILKQESELWSKVDNYPIPTANTQKAFADVLSEPSIADKEIKAWNKVFQKTTQTTKGLQSLERKLNYSINDVNVKPETKHFLKIIRDGIRADFDQLGAAADSGKIMIHDGKIIYPDALKQEAAEMPGKITKALEGMKDTPDTVAIMTALRDKNIPFAKAVGEGKEAYVNRIIKEYQNKIGPDVPIIKATEPPTVQALKSRGEEINKILSEAQPAGNVASAIKEAKNFSREQKFGRFDAGAVKDILRRGAEINGRKIPDADVARRFMNIDDADQLIKALGPEKARESMKGFIVSDFEKSVIDKSSLEVNEKALNRWLQKNYQVLDRYGMTGDFVSVAKAQKSYSAARAEMDNFNNSVAARMLNADPAKAIERAMQGGEGISASNTGQIMTRLIKQVKGNPDAIAGLKNSFKDFLIAKSENAAKTISGDNIISAAKIQRELRKYEPAMRILYQDEPVKLAALQNVQKAIEITSRSLRSPVGGGSDTYELTSGALHVLANAAGEATNASPKMVLIKKGLGLLNNMSKSEVDNVVARAIYDPELANVLMMAKRNVEPNIIKRKLAEFVEKAGIYTTTQQSKAQ